MTRRELVVLENECYKRFQIKNYTEIQSEERFDEDVGWMNKMLKKVRVYAQFSLTP
jgi:hypothetical protein